MTSAEAKKIQVTQKQAVQEIMKHSLNPEDFFAEVGKKELYKGSEVLNWLGY